MVGIKISILQGTANGTAVYAETHSPLTNANGLATLEIGGGTMLSGNFANINWANGPYFVKTETDLNGGVNYTITSTTQLLSVPYALYSKNGLPTGGINGQIITNCNGIPTWTFNGNCPGSIASLNCNDATITQSGDSAIYISIPYTGGDGNYIIETFNVSLGDVISNHGSVNFQNGNGDLNYIIYGSFSATDTIYFSLNISGQNCSITIPLINGQTGITTHTCGATNVHNPAKTYGTMTDQQGNIYKTIVIGNQEWMAENLKTTIYRNGNAITNVTANAQWQNLTTGAWSSYNNSSQNDCPYGKLYNWYAVADPRNVCPTGWHVPTDAEWTTLTTFLGGESIAGGKMKSTGTQNWLSPNTGATNESGFSGLPAAFRYLNGTFYNPLGYNGSWWSSTEDVTVGAWLRQLGYAGGDTSRDGANKRYGFSVRCLRD